MPRWDKLFDDLASQLEQEIDAEETDLAAEEERLRLGRLGLRDRLVGLRTADPDAVGVPIVLRDGGTVEVVLTSVGRDWLAGDLVGVPRSRRVCVIPLAAIAGVLPRRAQLRGSLEPVVDPSAGADGLSARLGLPFVLRDLCRRRSPVDVTTVAGIVHGTIDRVGRDHLDLAEHDSGTPRRTGAVRRIRVVPFLALTTVVVRS